MESFIKNRTNNPNTSYYPKGELVITKDFLKGGKNFRPSWKFSISSLNPNNEQWIYVDAVTGEIIRTTPRIYDVNTPCTAETRYSGTVGITGDSFTGGFRLSENRNGVNVQTLNLHGTTNYASATDFVNSNTSFTNGSWTNFAQDRAALDAHWGAENVLDYWGIVHNRNSIDGSGIRVLSHVHYGTSISNAFWDGSNNVMNYGDGDGTTLNPLVALDICGHEFGHGITQYTANLTYGTQESAALNEGFSDIWGACVEHWTAPTKQTWLMGEEIFATTSYTCIRNLQNPTSTTTYEGQHPDTYHGQFWSSGGEPHTNSTVLTHWFYLLSQGGSDRNNGQTSHASSSGYFWSVNGIGINDAQLIAFRAESVYLTSSATYADARTATTQAARDLFGIGSCQEIAATNAWYAVGVGDQYPASTINGDDAVCGSTSNLYTILNLPVGSTVQWDASPSGIVTINSPNSQQTTLTKNDNGHITLTATVNTCSGGTITLSKNIIAGVPTTFTGLFGNYPQTRVVTTDDGSNDINSDEPTYVTFTSNEYIAPGQPSIQFSNITLLQSSQNFPDGAYRWQYIKNSSYGELYLYMPQDSWAYFEYTLPNACGNGTFYLYFQAYQGAYYRLSPNPATDIVTVKVDEERLIKNKTVRSSEQDIREIDIVDKMGNILQRKTFGKGVRITSLNTSVLKPDIYVVRIFNGKTWKSLQLLKQ